MLVCCHLCCVVYILLTVTVTVTFPVFHIYIFELIVTKPLPSGLISIQILIQSLILI